MGQLDGGSQVSPAAMRPSPHITPQSRSTSAVQPAGQQPSPLVQAVTSTCVQTREQPASLPDVKSLVHASPSSQVGAQAPGWPAVTPRSQRSPGSRRPSPHTAGQSASVSAVQPAGQQPSPPAQATTGVAAQRALQLVAAPSSATRRQAPPAGQAAGQAPSQLSTGASTTPLPHSGAQSASRRKLPPGGQQPSPARKVVTGRDRQAAAQVPAPTSRSCVQGFASAQVVGHAPGRPGAMAVSQVSFGASTTPSPQVEEQSGSVAAVQPAGQQPSLAAAQAVTTVVWQRAL